MNWQVPEYLKLEEVTNSLPVNADTSDVVKHFEVAWNIPKSPKLLRDNIHIRISTSPNPIRIPVYGYIHEDHATNSSSFQDDE